MELLDSLFDKKNKILKGYIDLPDRISSDYSKEIETNKDYNGRQIFELLQNAEDAAVSIDNSKVLINVYDNILSISNKGKPFDLDGYSSLLISNNSPKVNDSNLKGNKGLGFRSVINWAEKIIIKSANIKMTFSKEIAKNEFTKLLSNQSVKDYYNTGNKKEGMAILACPEIEKYSNSQDYDTEIEIHFLEQYKSDIVNQLNSLTSLDILFLEHTKTIEIYIDNDFKLITKDENKTNNQYSIVTIETENGGTIEKEQFKVYTKNGDINGNDYSISLALNNDIEKRKNQYKLYNYFKTDINLPFRFVVNATFELIQNRNQIAPQNNYNKLLMQQIIQCIVEFANILSDESTSSSYELFNAFVSNDIIRNDLFDFEGFKDLYIKEIKKAKIFPLSNGKYANLIDNIVYKCKNYDFTKYLEFEDSVLLYSNDLPVNLYINFDIKDIPIDFLCNIINCFVDNNRLDISQKTEILYNYIKEYSYNQQYSQYIPYLLENSSGQIVKDQIVFVTSPEDEEEKQFKLPDFVDFGILNNEQVKDLKNYYSISDVKELANHYYYLKGYNNVRKYNTVEIVNSIITQIDDSIDNLKEFIDWAIDYKKQISSVNKSLFVKTDLMLPNTKGDLVYSNELYFGKNYGFNSTEEIITTILPNNILAEKNVFCSSNIDNDSLLELLSIFGVEKYPKKIYLDIKDDTEFLDSILKSKEIEIYGDKYSYTSNLNFSSTKYSYKVSKAETFGYNDFETMLKEAKFNNLIEWFYEDECILSIINNFEVWDDIKLTLSPNDNRKAEQIIYLSKYDIKKSYIKYCLQNVKWIETENGSKESVNNCCFENIGMSPFIETPKLLNNYKVEELLKRLGVAESIKKLSPSVLYTIILNLKDNDPNFSKTRSIYKKTIQASIADCPDDLEEKKKFLNEGYVACRKDNKKYWKPINEVYYSDNRIFSDSLTNDFYMLDLDKRCGEDNVEKVFGVKPLKNIKIVAKNIKEHILNNDFQRYFNEFKPYIIMVCDNNNRNYSKSTINNLNINIVSDIKTSYLDSTGKEYDYFIENFDSVFVNNDDGKSQYYILVKNCDSFNTLINNRLSDTVAEIIASVLKIEGDRNTFQTLFMRNINERNTYLKCDIDDENNYESLLKNAKCDVGCAISKKDDFWATIKKLSVESEYLSIKQINEDSIDYNKLSSLEELNKIIPNVFEKLNIDVDKYNEFATYRIEIRQYQEKVFRDIKNLYRTQITNYANTTQNSNNILERFESWNIDNNNYKMDDMLSNILDELSVNKQELDKMPDKEIINVSPSEELNNSSLVVEQEIIHYDYNDIDSILKNSDIYNQFNKLYFSNQTSKNTTHKNSGENIDFQKKAVTDQETGQYAEEMIYHLLNNQNEKIGDITKKSSNLGGMSDNCGYDLSYVDKNTGETFFVEVKSSRTKGASFYLSKNELDFATKNRDHYIIYLVLNLAEENGKKPLIYPLPNLFKFGDDESILNNSNMNIVTDKYNVKLKKEYFDKLEVVKEQ